MKKITLIMAMAMPVLFVSCKKDAVSEVSEASSLDAQPSVAQTGNGGPSGAHYNLNIIGVPKGKRQT